MAAEAAAVLLAVVSILPLAAGAGAEHTAGAGAAGTWASSPLKEAAGLHSDPVLVPALPSASAAVGAWAAAAAAAGHKQHSKHWSWEGQRGQREGLGAAPCIQRSEGCLLCLCWDQRWGHSHRDAHDEEKRPQAEDSSQDPQDDAAGKDEAQAEEGTALQWRTSSSPQSSYPAAAAAAGLAAEAEAEEVAAGWTRSAGRKCWWRS